MWMINFRVRDLDAMIERLRAAGVRVEMEGDEWPNGRLARLNDPEAIPSSSGSRPGWMPPTECQSRTKPHEPIFDRVGLRVAHGVDQDA